MKRIILTSTVIADRQCSSHPRLKTRVRAAHGRELGAAQRDDVAPDVTLAVDLDGGAGSW
jgi:hypothetical protein